MRFKYYKLSLMKSKNIKKKIFCLFIILLFFVIVSYILKSNIEPKILELCNSTSKSIALRATTTVIQDKISNVKYDELVNIKQDETGKVTAINSNVMELNRIASLVALGIQEKLNEKEESEIKIPFASLFFDNLFSAYGPKLKVKVVPTGSVSVDFKSEFESKGINQTRHKICIIVKTQVRIIAPFISKVNEYSDEITIAESVIVGDVPQSYYNIEGVKDITTNDCMNFI